MAEPFLAEVKIVGFNFAPRGWALCDGQILPINQNQSLYSLLGTTYGGNGRTDFALPDLRGRTPIDVGTGSGLTPRTEGQKVGQEGVTLSDTEVPTHTHNLEANSANANNTEPSNNVLSQSLATTYVAYNASQVKTMAPAVSTVGGGQAHNNMMPYLTLNFCIALRGLFPSRN